MALHAALLSLLLLFTATEAASPPACSARRFAGRPAFAACSDLPHLGASLHYTYSAAAGNLTIAFVASPPSAPGWVSWGINPSGPKMAGTQALVAFVGHNGTVAAKKYDLVTYHNIVEGKIAYEVTGLEAAAEKGGELTIYATLRLPAGTKTVSHVWQVASAESDAVLGMHGTKEDNLKAVGHLDLIAGKSAEDSSGAARARSRNIHGILNAVSWGVLLPVGAIVARYLKTFKSADPAWFYLHVSCQIAGYAVGVAGWGTGLKLGSESEGIEYSLHRSIGIAMFCLGTLQMSALLVRPKKDHKYRPYWKAYHLSMGYIVIILGVINVFKGIQILSPSQKWTTAYITILAVLGSAAALLEAFTWFIVLKGKRESSMKPLDLPSSGFAKQMPLNA